MGLSFFLHTDRGYSLRLKYANFGECQGDLSVVRFAISPDVNGFTISAGHANEYRLPWGKCFFFPIRVSSCTGVCVCPTSFLWCTYYCCIAPVSVLYRNAPERLFPFLALCVCACFLCPMFVQYQHGHVCCVFLFWSPNMSSTALSGRTV